MPKLVLVLAFRFLDSRTGTGDGCLFLLDDWLRELMFAECTKTLRELRRCSASSDTFIYVLVLVLFPKKRCCTVYMTGKDMASQIGDPQCTKVMTHDAYSNRRGKRESPETTVSVSPRHIVARPIPLGGRGKRSVAGPACAMRLCL